MKLPSIPQTMKTASHGIATAIGRLRTKKTECPRCLGIPVYFDPNADVISDSRGLGRWKRIVVGPMFNAFPPREQQALLLHEAGHCKARHLEKRLAKLWMLAFAPRELFAYCQAQEFEADRFAAGCGYGPDLARAFQRLKIHAGLLHPPGPERIARLLGVSN